MAVTIEIRTNKGTMLVRADKVKDNPMEKDGIRFYIHKTPFENTPPGEKWTVTEINTGCAVTSGRTKNSTLIMLEGWLKNPSWREAVIKNSKKFLEEHGPINGNIK